MKNKLKKLIIAVTLTPCVVIVGILSFNLSLNSFGGDSALAMGDSESIAVTRKVAYVPFVVDAKAYASEDNSFDFTVWSMTNEIGRPYAMNLLQTSLDLTFKQPLLDGYERATARIAKEHVAATYHYDRDIFDLGASIERTLDDAVSLSEILAITPEQLFTKTQSDINTSVSLIKYKSPITAKDGLRTVMALVEGEGSDLFSRKMNIIEAASDYAEYEEKSYQHWMLVTSYSDLGNNKGAVSFFKIMLTEEKYLEMVAAQESSK